ncbi:hypothetical protein [Limosilactobacillus equigenerosi]|uniref:hypothetical protein n=1 Tax=Limosilactobacillus equigenerosi TaxID=417373 RepID=UPI000704D0F8|nr:hypothetical protein [Limosilactobacillus equigenerosi]
MRFDSVIKFYSEKGKHYDPKVHGYVGGNQLVSEIMANVTDLGTTRSVQILGSINQEAKVLRLLNPEPPDWSFLTIDDGDKHYRRTTTRTVLKGNTLIVGGENG